MKVMLMMVGAAIAMTACGTVDKMNPFTSKDATAISAVKNAKKYACADKKSFYVRMENTNKNAWVIFADHEVNLYQDAVNSSTYMNGAMTLIIGETETTLTDGEKSFYSACKVANEYDNL